MRSEALRWRPALRPSTACLLGGLGVGGLLWSRLLLSPFSVTHRPPEARALLAPSALAIPAAAGTAREFLAAYYGSEWPALEARFEAEGLDLDAPYSHTPWPDVELEFAGRIGFTEESRATLLRDRMRWPEGLTRAYLQEEFGRHCQVEVDEVDVAVVAERVHRANLALREGIEDYLDQVDFLVRERFQEGRFLRAPFTTHGLDAPTGFHSESHAGFGWSIVITLTHEECPEVLDLERHYQALREVRDELVMECLRARAR
jgi:hypothetical protein